MRGVDIATIGRAAYSHQHVSPIKLKGRRGWHCKHVACPHDPDYGEDPKVSLFFHNNASNKEEGWP